MVDIHEGDETVLVVLDDQTFEFRIDDGTLVPVSDEVPVAVFDALDGEGYVVERPAPRAFDDLPFSGPYERGEAASVLGYDRQSQRYQKLGHLMKYGIEVSVRVHPDGTTELYEVNGEPLQEPITV